MTRQQFDEVIRSSEGGKEEEKVSADQKDSNKVNPDNSKKKMSASTKKEVVVVKQIEPHIAVSPTYYFPFVSVSTKYKQESRDFKHVHVFTEAVQKGERFDLNKKIEYKPQ